jgi:hypothetical protein
MFGCSRHPLAKLCFAKLQKLSMVTEESSKETTKLISILLAGSIAITNPLSGSFLQRAFILLVARGCRVERCRKSSAIWVHRSCHRAVITAVRDPVRKFWAPVVSLATRQIGLALDSFKRHDSADLTSNGVVNGFGSSRTDRSRYC